MSALRTFAVGRRKGAALSVWLTNSTPPVMPDLPALPWRLAGVTSGPTRSARDQSLVEASRSRSRALAPAPASIARVACATPSARVAELPAT